MLSIAHIWQHVFWFWLVAAPLLAGTPGSDPPETDRPPSTRLPGALAFS
jgi:hypothetical protein